MINTFLNFKTKNIVSQSFDLEEIQSANKVLFSLFTRYGDTIIDLVIIKEFISQFTVWKKKVKFNILLINFLLFII